MKEPNSSSSNFRDNLYSNNRDAFFSSQIPKYHYLIPKENHITTTTTVLSKRTVGRKEKRILVRSKTRWWLDLHFAYRGENVAKKLTCTTGIYSDNLLFANQRRHVFLMYTRNITIGTLLHFSRGEITKTEASIFSLTPFHYNLYYNSLCAPTSSSSLLDHIIQFIRK